MREMMDSGIKWIGDSPKKWSIIKNKYVFNIKGGNGFPDCLQGKNCGKYPFCKNSDINSKDIFVSEANNYVDDEDVKKYKLFVVPRYSIIYGKIGEAFKKNHRKINEIPCCIDNNVQASILYSKDFNVKYCYYLYTIIDMKDYDNGGTIPTINNQLLQNSYIPSPPINEQKAIANFLDKKCSEIDALIKDIEKQIEVLEDYKKSVITEAVTKGLNPNVEMKRNNEKWIPYIPCHWEIKKGKYCFETRNTKGNSINLEILSPTQKFGVIPQKLYEELTSMVTVKVNLTTNLMSFKTIHKGDYCISLRSFEGGFEYCNYEGVVSPAYTVFYPIVDVDKRFYKYLFKINTFISEMNSHSLSLRDGKPISFDDFGNTFIPYPNVIEQKQIADYLDEKCTEIDRTISDKKKQLDILTNYKKSLIYEYVTGKKEVIA